MNAYLNKATLIHWRKEGYRIVLVTGVFDLLHLEHIRFLQKAKAAGDKLIVGVETDFRVKQIKGTDRPINTQTLRVQQLTALKCVDIAFILPRHFDHQSAWEKLLRDLKPDIYAVSSHTSHLQNKRVLCQKVGVKFQIVHPHNPNLSTSLLIAKFVNPHLLVAPPRFTTHIIPGHGRGKDLNYPTLNLIIPPNFPYQHGIYAGYVYLNRRRYLGAFHYGPIPVFNQLAACLEVYLINRRRQITNSSLTFSLHHYLRPIKKFPTPAELTFQISQDVQLSQTLLKT